MFKHQQPSTRFPGCKATVLPHVHKGHNVTRLPAILCAAWLCGVPEGKGRRVVWSSSQTPRERPGGKCTGQAGLALRARDVTEPKLRAGLGETAGLRGQPLVPEGGTRPQSGQEHWEEHRTQATRPPCFAVGRKVGVPLELLFHRYNPYPCTCPANHF